jgi:hypothetical protein
MMPVNGLIASARRRFKPQRFRFSRFLPSNRFRTLSRNSVYDNLTSEKRFVAHLMPYLLIGVPGKL